MIAIRKSLPNPLQPIWYGYQPALRSALCSPTWFGWPVGRAVICPPLPDPCIGGRRPQGSRFWAPRPQPIWCGYLSRDHKGVGGGRNIANQCKPKHEIKQKHCDET